MKRSIRLVCLMPAVLCAADLHLEGAAVLCARDLPGPQQKAVEMLVEEVEKRAQIRWPVVHTWPADPTPVVVI